MSLLSLPARFSWFMPQSRNDNKKSVDSIRRKWERTRCSENVANIWAWHPCRWKIPGWWSSSCSKRACIVWRPPGRSNSYARITPVAHRESVAGHALSPNFAKSPIGCPWFPDISRVNRWSCVRASSWKKKFFFVNSVKCSEKKLGFCNYIFVLCEPNEELSLLLQSRKKTFVWTSGCIKFRKLSNNLFLQSVCFL